MADNLKEIFEEAGEFAEAYELGAIIATMWGEEASDSMFDKYR